METINLPAVFTVFKTFGVVGLVILLWYFDSRAMRRTQDQHKKEIYDVLARYQEDMAQQRRMYESNVSLVKDYHSVASDLKDVVIINTQAMTTISEQIRQNEFCPMQRVRKKQKIVGSKG